MTVLEVRCCCEAEKLLGWLNLPPGFILASSLAIPYERPDGQFGQYQMEICEIFVPYRGYYKAIKADGVPIEALRRLSNFHENVES